MQAVTVQLTSDTALKELKALQKKKLVKLFPVKDSKMLPGDPMTLKEFREMITESESQYERGESISLEEAKAGWEKQIADMAKTANASCKSYGKRQ